MEKITNKRKKKKKRYSVNIILIEPEMEETNSSEITNVGSNGGYLYSLVSDK